MRIIASIEDRQVINKILAHINRKQEPLVSIMTGTGIRAPSMDATKPNNAAYPPNTLGIFTVFVVVLTPFATIPTDTSEIWRAPVK